MGHPYTRDLASYLKKATTFNCFCFVFFFGRYLFNFMLFYYFDFILWKDGSLETLCEVSQFLEHVGRPAIHRLICDFMSRYFPPTERIPGLHELFLYSGRHKTQVTETSHLKQWQKGIWTSIVSQHSLHKYWLGAGLIEKPRYIMRITKCISLCSFCVVLE